MSIYVGLDHDDERTLKITVGIGSSRAMMSPELARFFAKQLNNFADALTGDCLIEVKDV